VFKHLPNQYLTTAQDQWHHRNFIGVITSTTLAGRDLSKLLTANHASLGFSLCTMQPIGVGK